MRESMTVEITEKPSVSEVTKGVILFLITLLAYAFYCLCVKVTMKKFNLNVLELMYYTSLALVPYFYVVVYRNKVDIFQIKQD